MLMWAIMKINAANDSLVSLNILIIKNNKRETSKYLISLTDHFIHTNGERIMKKESFTMVIFRDLIQRFITIHA